MAMRNSARGDGDSRVMWAIPPSKNRLMVRTGMPNARATSACASSCPYRLTTDSSAATTASDHRPTGDQPRRRPRNVEYATYTSSASNSSQLQLAVNWMPNRRNSRIEPRVPGSRTADRTVTRFVSFRFASLKSPSSGLA